MKAQNITLIGLGRMGTALGLAVKGRLDMGVVGYDADPVLARAALEMGTAVDKIENDLEKAAARADILVITTPISQLEGLLQIVGSLVQPHTLILDFSKLKGPGLKWARQYLKQGHYVGAAPVLAAQWLDDGREANTTAPADLFQNSLLCLMPAPEAQPRAVETAVNFGLAIGAQPYFIDPAEYDNLAQGTETLPGLVAAALFKALQQSTSWRDMLRFAGHSFSLGTLSLGQPEELAFMALNDKAATLRWLEAVVNELNTLRRLLYEDEPQVMTAVLADLSQEREKWLHKRRQNNWDERTMPDLEHPGMFGHMLGGLAPGNRKREGRD